MEPPIEVGPESVRCPYFRHTKITIWEGKICPVYRSRYPHFRGVLIEVFHCMGTMGSHTGVSVCTTCMYMCVHLCVLHVCIAKKGRFLTEQLPLPPLQHSLLQQSPACVTYIVICKGGGEKWDNSI